MVVWVALVEGLVEDSVKTPPDTTLEQDRYCCALVPQYVAPGEDTPSTPAAGGTTGFGDSPHDENMSEEYPVPTGLGMEWEVAKDRVAPNRRGAVL